MSIAGNIDDGKEPVATAGILNDHIVEVDKVSIGAADQQQPGGVVDASVPGQHGGEDSQGRLGEWDSF